MTLLLTVFAAIVSTAIWYTSEKARGLRIGMLVLMFWGASLMWLVDAVVEYLEVGAEEFFSPAGADMLNDSFLGASVLALGLTIWLASLLVKDPAGIVRKTLKNEKH